METVYLGLGSNLGNRELNLAKAMELICNRAGELLAVSEIRSYRPWGFDSSNDFLNQVMSIHTYLEPHSLLDEVLGIELEVGRVRQGSGYSDRVIDIDILFYGKRIINTKKLVVPHPLLHKRLFVLEPLAEVAAGFVHPVLDKSTGALLEELRS
jgi:2-amino-4-hydroxy-6-hydroxymethyldihydropteridine diphosphokinase